MQRALIGAILGVLSTTAAFGEDLTGTWQGHVHTGRVDRPYIFHISSDAQGHLAADVVIDTDWGSAPKADAITIDGRKLKFNVPTFGSAYDGELSGDGKSLIGTWSIGTRLVPLQMQRATPDTLWRETPHATRLVTVESGVNLEVLDWGGKGRPVVMLAGGGFTSHVFSQFAARLIPRYHVYGITRRGVGASSSPAVPEPVFSEVAPNTYDVKPLKSNPYDADRLGDDIAAVLDALHVNRAILMGHSIAGEEMTSMATRHADRVAGLVYLDAMAEFAFSDGKRYDALFTDEHPMRMTLPPGQKPHIDPIDAVLLGMHEYRSFPDVPALSIFALPHYIPGLTGPALAAFQASEQAAMDRMNRIRPLLPTVRIINYASADHLIWESNEADVLRDVNAFLGKLAP